MPRLFGLTNIDQHLRRSSKSLREVARANGAPVPGQAIFSAETEFSFSTAALIALLLYWSGSSRSRNAHGLASAKSLLEVIGRALVGDESFTFEGCCSGLTFVIKGGMVCLRRVFAGTELARCAIGKVDQASVSDTLASLGASCNVRGCREGSRQKLAKLAIKDLMSFLEHRLQFSWVFKDDRQIAANLPTLRLKSNRPRRIPFAKKFALVQCATNAKAVRRPTTLVAALNEVRMDGEPKEVASKSAARFVVTTLYQYWLSGRKMWEPASCVSLALDGGRVSGEDLMQQVYYSTEMQCGNWAPPQAPFPQHGKR